MIRKISGKILNNNSYSTLKNVKNPNGQNIIDPYNIYDQSLQRSGMYDSP
jgi:hypothetical protein